MPFTASELGKYLNNQNIVFICIIKSVFKLLHSNDADHEHKI
ncbi:hypothetical protein NTHI1209_01654 [Haemophilus influenzae]|uniref:Uncharacterized protein n=1 Tax=Haemophilus influenzae TaxID=727 RepID=A0A158SYS9_HAEIF|nr:hypothetical protein NTHI1209_01654 [Haemophilus influenzae]